MEISQHRIGEGLAQSHAGQGYHAQLGPWRTTMGWPCTHIPICHHRPVGTAINISMSPEYWVQESSVLNVTLWSLKDLEEDLAMQASVATLFTPVSEVAPFMLARSPTMTSTAQAHSGHFLPAPREEIWMQLLFGISLTPMDVSELIKLASAVNLIHTESLGEKKSQLKNYQDRICLWSCLWHFLNW